MPRRMRYNNLDNVSTDKTLKQFKQLREERRRKKKDYSFLIPNKPPELDYLQANREESTITWIGHSTFLIQYQGLNIVTDPVWAMRMGFQRRLTEPGIPIHQLPPIDVILISHSHYDHMHFASIRRIYHKDTTIIVPVGLGRKMWRKGFYNVHEMNWWERIRIGEVDISFVPTQHWTRRTPFDTNTSHWGGYVLEPVPSEAEKKPPVIYFAGDSGYFRGFAEIGERYQIDVALLPIGAYEPEWFMTSQHTTPEEALQAFVDVKAKLMIPMHYGTFRLADDTAQEALDRLEKERVRLGFSEETIRLLHHGETLRLPEE
ncbi:MULTISPECIES: MBL fold metallo-hydrolase [Paenibacillus]|uniref:L-ascorbate metabolism protein UlaG, beta-lactamase superfamily n=1 Tax=Paenibacillus barengoltzii J12 TaxID=935846 RepID=A0ABY1M069_9BACL|nr:MULTISPECIES: MBL fold metallo-hydrolase [Paenibacillus]MDU0330743.1 MBL fold metallo-hydrolase [Paenibacillus sp. 3LSP]SMF45034.1 L-ascorbate metabolism protein UlaG, beta-lactamase superfamily [Paenibacillus barengoltzii J12]